MGSAEEKLLYSYSYNIILYIFFFRILVFYDESDENVNYENVNFQE